MICIKCKSKDRVEEHHLWCKFMNNPHGYPYHNNLSRVNLCWDCHHMKVHYQIIVPILNKYARLTKQSTSEYYLWKKIAEVDKPKVIKEVVEATLRFLEEDRGDDSISEV